MLFIVIAFDVEQVFRATLIVRIKGGFRQSVDKEIER